MNILVVDDEIAQVDTLKRGLRSRGHHALEVTNPQEALNILDAGAGIDLVITDYLMPVMNGIELLENIRRDHSTLPVIIMTAYGETDLLVNALHNSCNGYIEKPFTLDQLIREIETAKANAHRNTGCNEALQSIPMLIHQINNPLMAISGSAEMALFSLDDPVAVKEYMDRIIEATNEACRLNKEMIDATRRSKEPMDVVDITALLDDCVDMFRDLLSARGVSVERQFPGSPLLATGHTQDLKQLFKNLILNSIDAMEDKKKCLIRLTAGRSESLEHVAVSAEDTGCGIPQDYLGRLFDPYFTLKSKGSCLGLAVVKRVIEDHEGRIEVQSEIGKGSRFRVLLSAHAA